MEIDPPAVSQSALHRLSFFRAQAPARLLERRQPLSLALLAQAMDKADCLRELMGRQRFEFFHGGFDHAHRTAAYPLLLPPATRCSPKRRPTIFKDRIGSFRRRAMPVSLGFEHPIAKWQKKQDHAAFRYRLLFTQTRPYGAGRPGRGRQGSFLGSSRHDKILTSLIHPQLPPR
jgi:hypothetical protein